MLRADKTRATPIRWPRSLGRLFNSEKRLADKNERNHASRFRWEESLRNLVDFTMPVICGRRMVFAKKVLKKILFSLNYRPRGTLACGRTEGNIGAFNQIIEQSS